MTDSANAITAPAVMLWDRPTMKTEETSQPPYTDEQKTARKSFTESLTALLQEHIGEIGGFITTNEKGNRFLLAVSVPVDGLKVTHPITGAVVATRESNLNLSIPLRKDEESAATPMTAVELTPAQIFEQMQARRQAASKK